MAIRISSVTVSPQSVTTGQQVTVTITAQEATWGVIKSDFQNWNDIKTGKSNWNAILNYN